MRVSQTSDVSALRLQDGRRGCLQVEEDERICVRVRWLYKTRMPKGQGGSGGGGYKHVCMCACVYRCVHVMRMPGFVHEYVHVYTCVCMHDVCVFVCIACVCLPGWEGHSLEGRRDFLTDLGFLSPSWSLSFFVAP